MSNQNYGLTEWENVQVSSGRNNNRRDQFLRLQNGSNIVRVLTKPHEYLVHRYKANEKDSGYGEKVMSSLANGRDVLFDEKGMKPKKRWLVGVIDRKTQSYKILDMSVSVFKSVQTLVKDEDWGDPTQYDIDIQVDKNGGATGYYTVMPKKPKPLSAADLEIKEQINLEDLKRRCTPPTPEQMEERIRQIHAKSEGTDEDTSVSDDDDDDDDLNFPPVEGSDAA